VNNGVEAEKNQPLVSVIVCVYNGGELFKNNIASVSRLKVPEDTKAEFLFVDNNSTDGSEEIIKEYVLKYPNTFHCLWEPTPGKPYTLNLGIKEAGGEIIAFTDQDTILPEDWLLRIKEGFEKHDCVALGGRILPIWEAKPPAQLIKNLNAGMGGFGLSLNEKMGYCAKGDLVGGNIAFKKECFRKYGGFRTDIGPRPKIHMGGEDTEFSQRLIRAGEKVFYYPPMTAYHQIPKDRMVEKRFFQSNFLSISVLLRAKIRPPNIRKKLMQLPEILFKLILSGFSPRKFNHPSPKRYAAKVFSLFVMLSYKCAGEEYTIRLAKIFGLIDNDQYRELLKIWIAPRSDKRLK
jgi:glucosyl-dolichyl phosphate glucuronosyltransferase